MIVRLLVLPFSFAVARWKLRTNSSENRFPKGVSLSEYALLDWIKTVIIEKHKNANPDDMNLIKVVDTEDEVVAVLDNFYKKYNLSPNF